MGSDNLKIDILLRTIQLGGKIVFIDSGGDRGLVDWQRAIPHGVPTLIVKAEDVQNESVRTRPEDLIIFLSKSGSLVASLGALLQGQRVQLGSLITHPCYFDYVWEDVNLLKWEAICQSLLPRMESFSPVGNFREAFEAPAIFLDRDDVLIKNVPYNSDPLKVELRPGVVEFINKSHQLGYWVVIVTNQSGLGRDKISWEQYRRVHQKMLQLLAENNAWIDETIFASYIEKAPIEAGLYYAGLRKPRGGMFQIAREKLRINMQESTMVGDSASDLVAAASVGVNKLFLMKTEKAEAEIDFLRKNHPDLFFVAIQDFTAVPL